MANSGSQPARDGETLSDETLAGWREYHDAAARSSESRPQDRIVVLLCDALLTARAEVAELRAVVLEVGNNGLREAIDAAIKDETLSRNDLRDVLEDAEYQCSSQLTALDDDDERDACAREEDEDEMRNMVQDLEDEHI